MGCCTKPALRVRAQRVVRFGGSLSPTPSEVSGARAYTCASAHRETRTDTPTQVFSEAEALDTMNTKVRSVHVGTHSPDIHHRVRALMLHAGRPLVHARLLPASRAALRCASWAKAFSLDQIADGAVHAASRLGFGA